MGLTQVKTGETAKILAIEGGRGLKQKLFLRGLFEGKVLRIVANHGPVTVEVDRSMVAIGRGMAHKIVVTTNSQDQEGTAVTM
jgi:ferrous iron transport protein A